MQKTSEFNLWQINGFVVILIDLILGVIIYGLIRTGIEWGAVVLLILTSLTFSGFFVVQPNKARVLTFLGRYIGSVRDAGFHWSNPFAVRKSVSLRVHNFNSDKLKVNDSLGNPIEIGAVIVWQVVDSAKAIFDVEKYEEFVAIQSETALRAMAMHYPYDVTEHNEPSLRGNPDEVAESIKKELHTRLEVAGVEVLEARISHLAYAPEIAQAMLRRQQAQAIISARQKIVDGAVGMVEMALKRLSEQKIVVLDEERKAVMVNNLMVALVSEQATQPIINTGTLY